MRVIRNTLPDAPIVYTLHEYVPICHHDGQMVRTLQQGALPGGVAAPLQRVLSRDQPADLLHAQALHPVPPEAGRPLHRARPSTCVTATSTGASRPSKIQVEPQGMMPVTRPPAGGARAAPAQPLRVLRPAQPVQGRRRAAGGDGDPRRGLRRPARDPRREPARSSRSSSASASTALLKASSENVTFAGPYERSDLAS